jgi:hypothetical protein
VSKGDSQPTNPYSAPREHAAFSPTRRLPGLIFWRAYIALHVVVVIATAVFVVSGEGTRLPGQLASVVEPGVVLGIAFIPAGPFVATYLIMAGCRIGGRYFVAAAAEVFLWAAHFFAAQPLVQ